jgi:hypothetical protein
MCRLVTVYDVTYHVGQRTMHLIPGEVQMFRPLETARPTHPLFVHSYSVFLHTPFYKITTPPPSCYQLVKSFFQLSFISDTICTCLYKLQLT